MTLEASALFKRLKRHANSGVSRADRLPQRPAERHRAIHAAVITHRRLGTEIEKIGRRLWRLGHECVGTTEMVCRARRASITPRRPAT